WRRNFFSVRRCQFCKRRDTDCRWRILSKWRQSIVVEEKEDERCNGRRRHGARINYCSSWFAWDRSCFCRELGRDSWRTNWALQMGHLRLALLRDDGQLR